MRHFREAIGFAAPAALLVAVALAAVPHGADAPAVEKTADARLRRPIVVVPANGGRRLFVANRRAGSVSVLDVERGRVSAEVVIGQQLADLADAGDSLLLAVEEAAGELIVLDRRHDLPSVVGRVRVGDSPVSVGVLPGALASVACLWPRQLAVVDLSAADRPRVRKRIDLPFTPRAQLVLPGGAKVVVADAFGGRLAMVDAGRDVVESVRSVPGHNLRGLAVSADGKQLLLSQQVLAEETPARADEVRWGNVITNGVRALALEDVVKVDADLLRHSRLYPLGEFRRGAADPAGLAVEGGRVIVTLAGTGEVAFGLELHGDWPRLAAGRRPTAIAAADGRAFVADTFGDAVHVFDIEKREKVTAISLGAMPPLRAVERGELLFFDGRLSVEGWMSCHSCHSDGHTNGLRSDTLGDGSYGAPKRVPTLRGVGDTGPWTWNGSRTRLEEQVRQSIRTTMHGRPTEQQVADLTAYMRALAPLPARRGQSADEAVRRGKAVFASRDCIRCHAPPAYTTPRTYEVGLEDEMGKSLFNPPSLRGIGHGVAFFHDGRASSLEEVLTRHHHQIPADMPRKELDDLLAFLKSL
jgi:YVTN family beta-propeller protein